MYTKTETHQALLHFTDICMQHAIHKSLAKINEIGLTHVPHLICKIYLQQQSYQYLLKLTKFEV
jgi:hypothetical protein